MGVAFLALFYPQYHLVMTNIAMENPQNKWRYLAGKIIFKRAMASMAMLVITRGYIIFVQLWPWNEQSLITSHLPMVEISQNYCPFLGYPISIDIQWMPCSKNVHPSRVCDFFLGGLLSQKKAEKDWFSLEMMRENILLNHHWITILDLFWALLYSILHQPREGKPTTMGHKVGQNGPCDYLSHMLHGAAIFTHITGWVLG